MSQQSQDLSREYRTSNIPKHPRSECLPIPYLKLRRLISEPKETIYDGWESTAAVRDMPSERCEVEDGLSECEIHESSRSLEVELNDALWV